MYIYTYMHTCVNMCIHIYIYVYTYIHTYMHTVGNPKRQKKKKTEQSGSVFAPAHPISTLKMKSASMFLGLTSVYLRTGLLEASTLDSGVKGVRDFILRGLICCVLQQCEALLGRRLPHYGCCQAQEK